MQHNDLLGLAFGVRDGLPVITAKSMGKLHELLPWKQWIFACWFRVSPAEDPEYNPRKGFFEKSLGQV